MMSKISKSRYSHRLSTQTLTSSIIKQLIGVCPVLGTPDITNKDDARLLIMNFLNLGSKVNYIKFHYLALRWNSVVSLLSTKLYSSLCP